ncbi:MAG: hypothetical protein C0391_09155 [Anaerolinea sp.]|nr:hypothetical protein [Anaerolinea sp.]
MFTYWDTLQKKLKPGINIRNWTILKGYLGDSFQLSHVDQNEIVIQSPKAKSLQRISRDEFEKIAEIWPAYKAGCVQRQQIREMTFHSKYILSILHWLDEIIK